MPRRLAYWLHDAPAARAPHPDVAVVLAAVQLSAALVLRDEGHECGEDVRGAESLAQMRLDFNDSTGFDVNILTPEPAMLLLFGTIAAGLGLGGWRRRGRPDQSAHET